MTQLWQPGTQYNSGDEVVYDGVRYRIIQPHRSQGDWTPPVTPALWGRMQEEQHHGDHYQQQPQHHQQQPQQQQHYQQPPPPQYGDDKYTQGQGPAAGGEHGKQNWFDEHKKEIGLVGGIAAGAAILGAGIGLYKHHEHSEEQKAEAAASSAAWVQEAENRARQFQQYGPQNRPYTWVLNRGKDIPQGAVIVDKEHSWYLHVCRVFWEGSVQIGKASNAFKKGGVIGYGHDEHHVDTYEILLGDMDRLKWVKGSGKLDLHRLGAQPVDGGYDHDGTKLYVAKAHHKGVWHPGKVSTRLDGAFIPYDGSEKEIKEYEVLCVA